jgi:hypothetical protein
MAEAARRAREGGDRPAGDGSRRAEPPSSAADDIGPRRLIARSRVRAARPALDPLDPALPGDARRRRAGQVGTWRSRHGAAGAVVAGAAVAAVIVGALVAVVAFASGTPAPARTAARAPAAHSSTSPPATSPPAKTIPSTSAAAPGAAGGGGTTTPASAPTTAPDAAAPSGGPPRISSVSPPSGPAGARVVLAGSGLFSADGDVTAYFGGAPAPTSCPTQTSCTVTVPDLGLSPTSVTITVVTSSGPSNGASFAYQ